MTRLDAVVCIILDTFNKRMELHFYRVILKLSLTTPISADFLLQFLIFLAFQVLIITMHCFSSNSPLYLEHLITPNTWCIQSNSTYHWRHLLNHRRMLCHNVYLRLNVHCTAHTADTNWDRIQPNNKTINSAQNNSHLVHSFKVIQRI